MSDTIYENENYKVVETDDAIGEDNKYGRQGYALVNKNNGFVESTSMLRPNLIFLADQADGMMRQLTEEQDVDEVLEGITEDVVVPH